MYDAPVFNRAISGLIMDEPLIFDRSREGRVGFSLPEAPQEADEATAVSPRTCVVKNAPHFRR